MACAQVNKALQEKTGKGFVERILVRVLKDGRRLRLPLAVFFLVSFFPVDSIVGGD